MDKKTLCIILTIVLITMGVYCKPLAVQASNTSGSSVGVAYTASEIWLLLMALAGVSAEEASVSSIFDGATMDVGELINDVMPFSRDLGLALYDVIGPGVAGAQTITMSRPMWNQWKEYWRQKAGTTIGSTTNSGTISNNVKVWGTGSTFNIGYNISGYTPSTGSITIKVGNTPCILFACPMKYNGHIWRYLLYFVPVTLVDSSNVGAFVNSFTYTYSGADIKAGYGSEYLGSTAGYCLRYELGHNTSIVMNAFPLPAGTYITEPLEGYNTSSFNSLVAQKIVQYRTDGTLTQNTNVEVFPVEGIGEEAATTAGQDVIGFANTATQEEGEDVVIEGPLDIALPAEANLEVLLRQLATNEITYDEFVSALALEAVDTKTETKAQVEAKEQAITRNPSNGVYTVSLDDLFPFCIPFDLYDMLNCLKAEPEAPEVEISLPIGYDGNNFTWQDYTISLEAFDTVAQVGRIFWYILFCIGLMLLTRKLIEG